MSYILEALKKSERARALREQPSRQEAFAVLEESQALAHDTAPTHIWLFGVLFGVIAIMFLMLLWMLWQQQSGIIQNQLNNSTAASTPNNTPVIVVQNSPPYVSNNSNIPPPNPAYNQPVPQPVYNKEPVITYSDLPIEPPSIKPVEKTVNTVSQSKSRLSPMSQNELGDIPLIDDLPLEFSSQLPKLSIDVHAYSQDKTKRFVLLNLKRYREGDMIQGDLQLLEITSNSIILSRQGVLFQLPLEQDI